MNKHVWGALALWGLIGAPAAASVGAVATAASAPAATGVRTEVPPEQAIHSPLLCDGVLRYTPIATFDATNYTATQVDNGQLKFVSQPWPKDKAQRNALLPNIATEVVVQETGATASLGGLFGGTAKQKRITIDFMKYRSESIKSAEQTLAFARVGAGMRLKIDVWTTEANLGGSLLSLAASAKANKTWGSISVDVVGLSAADVTLSMPFTTDLSEGSIQKIVEALAVVKSRLHDPASELSPQFVARIVCERPSAEPALAASR